MRICGKISPFRLFGTLVTAAFLAATAMDAGQPARLHALPAGKPDPPMSELFSRFKNPPPGYGEVAFYWWMGDTLTRERMLWQLDQLAGRGVMGLQVNYAHSDSGGLSWGVTYPSQPKLFSEQWWELFGWFMREAKQRGMAVSLSDYTLGVGQGSYVDEALAEHPELTGSELRFEKRITTGALVRWRLPGKPLALVAYRMGNDSLPVPGTGKDLSQNVVQRELQWMPEKGPWVLSCVWSERVMPSYNPMHRLAGKAYIEHFFGRFARRFPGEAGKGINYFFSDELSFRLRYPIWDDAFSHEFTKRKGYDIRPHLPALFLDTGPETPRIRLDYNDVMVALSEEHFFRPLYQWHEEHGMTFGCDHGGRGRDVAEFGDYFRTQRWNQGPGCDQPRLEQDIIKNKVASSIAHLYRRPRVWLEGFHSSGWGTTTAGIADAIFGNFVMGQNLLTLHGLYYSTHGGWWEWAPPCNHFRMPYWQHIAPLMHTVQRLSYLLSQGTHRCDVAILYPVEPVIAGTAGQDAVSAAFAAGEALYNAGIDFDFIDYESLARSTVRNGRILVSGEEYRLLIIPSMKTIRYASLARAHELVVSGGPVINIGTLPEASEKGRGNREFASLRSRLFGAAETKDSTLTQLQRSRRGGAVYQCNRIDSLSHLVSRLFPRDFAVVSFPPGAQKRAPRVMHRRVGDSDIYAVYNLPAGTECFFRSKGRVELWDSWTGESRPFYSVRSVNEGARLQLPLSEHELQLIVFTPGGNDVVVEHSTLSAIDAITMADGKLTVSGQSAEAGRMEAAVRWRGTLRNLAGDVPFSSTRKLLAGPWGFEVQPVLDNQWGDFHWPPTRGLLGPEVRRFAYAESDASSDRPHYSGGTGSADTVSSSFGPQFWKLGPLPGIIPFDTLLAGQAIDPNRPVTFSGKEYVWHPYPFSWRWGVEDDPGHQGYHGLKEKVHDEFIRLGKAVQAWEGAPSVERQAEEGGRFYCLFTGVVSPAAGNYTLRQGAVRATAIVLNGVQVDTAVHTVSLKTGLNTLLLWYDRPCATYFVLQKPGGMSSARAGAGTDAPEPAPLAMRWYRDTTILRYDARFNDASPQGRYSFISAPGMKRMRFSAYGVVEVTIAGSPAHMTKEITRSDGAAEYLVELERAAAKPAEVMIRVGQERGYYGGAALPEPIRLECERGLYETGDWSRNDALYAYSGGARYSTSLQLSAEEAAQKVELDLGSVATTAEVWINGNAAGLKVAPPWLFDISRFVRAGDNAIEVRVYNTAANHYTSIPTRYRGSVASGLLGPVAVSVTGRGILKEP